MKTVLVIIGIVGLIFFLSATFAVLRTSGKCAEQEDERYEKFLKENKDGEKVQGN